MPVFELEVRATIVVRFITESKGQAVAKVDETDIINLIEISEYVADVEVVDVEELTELGKSHGRILFQKLNSGILFGCDTSYHSCMRGACRSIYTHLLLCD